MLICNNREKLEKSATVAEKGKDEINYYVQLEST